MAELTLRGVRLCPQRPRVIVPLYAADLTALVAQARAAAAHPAAELVELRLDPLPQADWPAALAQTRAAVAKPLLLTVRTKWEGGCAELPPTAYAAALLGLLENAEQPAAPDVLDIEWSAGPALVETLRAAAVAAGAVPLYSSHNFAATPPTGEMVALLTAMADAGAGIAKLAVMPANAADTVRLLRATARAAAQRPATPLLTMSMGALGTVTRYCGGAFGSVATFGTLTASSAPGQPPAEELIRQLEIRN